MTVVVHICPVCRSGLVMRFDHIANRAGWFCMLCRRWEGSNAA